MACGPGGGLRCPGTAVTHRPAGCAAAPDRGQVEEQRRQQIGVRRELDVLVPRPTRHGQRAVAHRESRRPARPSWWTGIREAPFEVRRVAPVLGCRLVPQEGAERPAVGLQRHLDAHEVTDRREHVDRLGHGVDHPSPRPVGLAPRVDHDQRARGSSRPRTRASRAANGRRPSRRGRWSGPPGSTRPGPLASRYVEERGQPVVHLALCPVVGGPDLAAFPLVVRSAPTSGRRHGERTERVDAPPPPPGSRSPTKGPTASAA